MRAQLAWVAVAWASAVVGVSLAVTSGDWGVAAYAVANAISAAGWLIATRQWQLWRAMAERLGRVVEECGVILRWDEPPD